MRQLSENLGRRAGRRSISTTKDDMGFPYPPQARPPYEAKQMLDPILTQRWIAHGCTSAGLVRDGNPPATNPASYPAYRTELNQKKRELALLEFARAMGRQDDWEACKDQEQRDRYKPVLPF